MRNMMGERAIRELIQAELAPGPIANEQAAIEEDIRARAATFFHPSGTCRMGSDPTAVVDPRLRVIGLQGLRIADGSIMPAALNALHTRTNDHDRREGRRYDSRGYVIRGCLTHPNALCRSRAAHPTIRAHEPNQTQQGCEEQSRHPNRHRFLSAVACDPASAPRRWRPALPKHEA
jgi:hypothetical protein